MGQLANRTKGNQLAQATPTNDFKMVLRSQWPKIQEVLPKTMSADRFFQLAVSAYNSEPKLADCSIVSVLSCVMKCAALGMEPSAVDGLGRAYILPFNNRKTRRMEATFILGYKGMLDLARRSGELKSISARAVYEGDEFEYAYGLNEDLRHVPRNQTKNLTHAYCVAHFKDGGHYFIVLSREEIEAARKASKAGNSGPWVTNYDAMAIKTAVRRAFPYLPVSVVAQEAAASDEQTPDYSSVLNPTFDLPNAQAVPESEPEQASGAFDAPVGVDTETGEIVSQEGPETLEEYHVEFADEDIEFGPEGE